jgi:hypothetical protein
MVDQIDTDPVPPHSFLISGSDGADGRYLVNFGDPPDIAVQGESWSLRTEVSVSWEEPDWSPTPSYEEMAVLPGTGLTILLDTTFQPSLGGQPNGIRLACISLDETINPPQRPNPYDFTISQED